MHTEQVKVEGVMSQEELIERLTQDMVERGWPEDRAREALDLAVHAVDQALATFQRTMEATPDILVMLQGTTIGAKLLAERSLFVAEKTKELAEFAVAGTGMSPEEFAAAAARIAGDQ